MRSLSRSLAAILATVFSVSTAAGAEKQLTENEQGIAKLAINTLAAELQVAPDRIELDTVRAVDWPDSSIGCPQPGRSYLQVITPGHKITLRANEQIYVVHESNGNAFVCREDEGARRGDAATRARVRPANSIAARKDLAERLRSAGERDPS